MENTYTGLGLSETDLFLLRKYNLTYLLDKIQDQRNQLERQKEQLEGALDKIETDLKSARKAQMNLLPNELHGVPQIEFKARFFPSQYVSGDIYNVFRLDENHIGAYHIDISGHGVPAALFSVSLSQLLNTNISSRNLLKVPVNEPPYYKINPPDLVISMLNEDHSFERYGVYFTMIYSIINLQEKKLSYIRAGHNPPLMLHKDGSIEMPKEGGLPVGWDFPREDEVVNLSFEEGDRFFMYSDGIIEATNFYQELYGVNRLVECIQRDKSQTLDHCLDSVITDLKSFSMHDSFEDDVSIVGIELK